MARRRKSSGDGASLLILFVVGIVAGFVRLWHRSPPLALGVLAVVLGGFAWLGNSGVATDTTPYQPPAIPSLSPQPTPFSFSFTPPVTPSPLASPASRTQPSATIRDTKKSIAPLRAETRGRSSGGSSAGGGCGDGYYVNSDGDCIPRPVRSSTAPPGASAQCRDSTYSFSQNRRGTCSRHGGVSRWL